MGEAFLQKEIGFSILLNFWEFFQCPLVNVKIGLALFSFSIEIEFLGLLNFICFQIYTYQIISFWSKISLWKSLKFLQQNFPRNQTTPTQKKKITCCRITLSLFIYLLKHNKIVIKYNMNKFNVDSGIWHIFALKFPSIKFTPAFLGKMYFPSWS